MYQALYRKYRPKNFFEVVGQKVAVKTLINAINNNKISHAYIFSGPRGTGKTSIAKIFAKTVNCKNAQNGHPCEKCENCIDYLNNKTIDIIEIDAASNNGVDEIRNLRNSVNLVPNNSKYKVYIIDEVHMLSTSAFNALLKTLEEPPEFVIFILATTELYKVPETIISRCQNFDFQRISNNEIIKRLSFICDEENIKITDNALKNIAIYSKGGMRDAISLLDQLSSYKNDTIDVDDVNLICGIISDEQIFELIENIINKKINEVLKNINRYNDDGKNLIIIFEKIVSALKNTLIYANVSEYFSEKYEIESYSKFLELIDESKIYEIIDILNKYIKDMKLDNNKQLLSQLCILKIYSVINNESSIILNEKINKKNEYYNDDINKNDKTEKIFIPKEVISINNFQEFRDRRINNSLANFNKKDLIEFKEKYGEIKNYINDDIYGSIVSILLDGEIKIKGREYVTFVYKDKQFVDYFNNMYKKIEELLFKLYNKKYKVIAINYNEWEEIKNEFNECIKKGIKKFVLKEDILLNINENDNIKFKNNDIDNMFKEIVKYE